jgi:peroxiredoxin
MGFIAWAAAAAVLGLLLILVTVVLYQLVKQQGRLVLRLDEVERLLAQAGIGAAAAQPAGLEVGTEVAPFRLPDLDGNDVALEDFRGKRVLLVHWSPGCGFCDMIAEELAGLDADLRQNNVQLLFASYGDAEANRKLAAEHGLKAPILLLKDAPNAIEAFQRFGTPVAYLLDEEGKVARPIAIGAEQVPALARELAETGTNGKRLPGKRSVAASKIVRDGRKAGTPAPAFELPDIYGRMVSLEEYRGRKVLLVFSDPHCGPCEELLPQLARLHREHRDNGLAVVMVGRGEAEENRMKAEAYGLEFPVVLQKKWEISREYGMFATPVAFLIDESGVIEREVAQGGDQILTLVSNGGVPAGRSV